MKKADLDAHIDGMIKDILALREAGQKEYAHGETDNVFNNFMRLAGQLDTPKEKVLWTYLAKHLDGIVAHIKGHRSQREPVHGRVKDAIVYLILLDAMFVEAESATTNADNIRIGDMQFKTLPDTMEQAVEINQRNFGLGNRSDPMHDME